MKDEQNQELKVSHGAGGVSKTDGALIMEAVFIIGKDAYWVIIRP